MEATKLPLASIFTGHRVFDIPFYQRSYVWKKEQWERFLEDMEFVSIESKDYFLGSAILKQQNLNMGVTADHRTVIDGQQRFTTIVIFCKALCLKTGELDEFDRYFMVRNKKESTKKCALVHSMNDRKDFEQVVSLTEDKPIDDAGNSSILQAYNYFQEKIDVNKVDIDELLSHLIFIDIELHPNDDEQAIFDTINSLGVRLTTAELLKNYFFTESTLEEYQELWVPIFEKDKGTSEYWNFQITAGRLKRNNIDAFFSAFLNIKIQDREIGVDNEHKNMYRRVDSIFASYKDLIATYNIDKKELYQEIIEYAKLYAKYINSDVVESDIPSKSCVERINFMIFTLDCSTMLPYILYVLKNVKNEKERNDIFGYLESYVVRRAICKSENNSFSDLFSEILIGNEIKTFENLKSLIENRDEMALALPNDEKMQECFHDIEQPNKRALAILYLMESRVRNNQPHATKILSFSEYSLEHIMPKKYEKSWPLNDGYDEETRRMMINTLGNMAMLPQKLNSSVSNADWNTKKNGKGTRKGISFFASDLVTMKGVVTCPEWNEDTIWNRAEWLANIAIKIWPSYQETNDDDFDIEAETKLDQVNQEDESAKSRNMNHDNTKYSFDGTEFLSKSEFVVTLVRKYLENHPQLTYKELKGKYPDRLCAKGYKFRGFLCTEKDYNEWNNKYKEKRYQPNKENHRLTFSDGVVFYVNTQWTKEGVDKLVKIAKADGFSIYTRNKS